ncbi:hypothetical protein M3Y97_00447100 [Aphelenchoides bicaudatus]|nr:hypothetical protein M3Y97_00447100 [Aphelenchoides bicaudatus]
MATELIVSDFRCAIHLDKCPKYCIDSKFSELYCDVRCWSITEQERQLHCGKYNERMYYPNASSTYKPVLNPAKPPINWTATYKDYRTFYGVYSYDLVQFQGFLDPNSDKDNLKIADSRFISGLMLDSRIFTTFTGIFGVAPPLDGEHFIVQAKRTGNISNAIITVDGNYNVVTFGELENEKCQNWTGIKPLVGNQWVLQATNIELMNKKLAGLNTVLIDPCLNTLAAPNRTINQLLGDKIIFKRNVTDGAQYPFTAKCNAQIPLKFTFGGTDFVFRTIVVNPMKTEGKLLFQV